MEVNEINIRFKEAEVNIIEFIAYSNAMDFINNPSELVASLLTGIKHIDFDDVLYWYKQAANLNIDDLNKEIAKYFEFKNKDKHEHR